MTSSEVTPIKQTGVIEWLNNNDTLTTILVVVLLIVVLVCCAKTICAQFRQMQDSRGGTDPSRLTIPVGEAGSRGVEVANFDDTPIHKPPVSSPVPVAVKMPDFESLVPPPSPPPVYKTPKLDKGPSIRARDRRQVKSVGSAARGSSFIARLRKSFRRRQSQENTHVLESGQTDRLNSSTPKNNNNNYKEDNDDVF